MRQLSRRMKLSYLKILLIILLPILVFLHLRGVIFYDEGYILNSSEKILNGLLPFRDFDFAFTPLSIFLTAISFAILSPSILSERILMLIVSLISCIFIFKTVYLATKNRFYGTLSTLIFVSWGSAHINFAWPVMFAIPFGILVCFCFLKFWETNLSRYLFLAGVFAFLVFLCKQNFGVAILFPFLAFLIFSNFWKKINLISVFLYGYIWSFIAFTLFLLQTGSIKGFVNNFYVYTIQRILINGSLNTGFIDKSSFILSLLKLLLYLLPFILSLISIFILNRRNKYIYVFLPIFVIAFYLLGIRPTTDYDHLVPLIAMFGIPIALILRFSVNYNFKTLMSLFSIILIIAGFQTALFKGYYKWESPLSKNNNFIKNPKVNIFVDDKYEYEINSLSEVVDNNSPKNGYIFVNPYSPMIYFVTNRKEAVKSNILLKEVDETRYYQKAMGELIAKKIPLVILGTEKTPDFFKTFIAKNYHLLKTVESYKIFKLNP
jgi:hypothetical protein